ncbi:DinB family protein [Bacillus sp. DTU_2020_1000418_1_SI_GHA_SEK_038]|uniref:DinB family protein n=1 Tax=Bacillus sp. DTU_2020_1000418_1_SI_GHA_SEK_038 TaxID=3077585 RepID=UPI0028E1E59D|nr:DinB family protein [Bacillus sp. DTU_2020_1000418_1_SI_GHA_SEK_038]WNS76299.1 DinB family protein [Bacillus sp. DTU_2020_1000418_1_SI_GHA_SEK_038]
MYQRPDINEYPAYYSAYVNLVPDGEMIVLLNEQLKATVNAIKGVTEKQAQFQYDSNKWTVKEVIGHLADTERIMAYRILCIARGETSPLPGFDDNLYVQNGSFNQLSMEDLLKNFSIVRQSTIVLLKSLDPDAWLRKGNANGSEITVRAVASIIAGHELHHRNILQERYFMSSEYPSN